jgi:hypothetical protein
MNLKTIVETVQHEVETLLGNHTKNKRFESHFIFPDESTAQQAFERAKDKLWAVNGWSNLPGFTATFTVHDQQSKSIGPKVLLSVGYFIRIDLPGPLPPNWVRVIAIQEDDMAAQFTVAPCQCPQAQEGSASEPAARIEHFFTDEASSTFRVERQGTQLVACEIGRNERVNNAEETAGHRSVVNTLMAAGGWALFQQIQWEKLTHYLVEP